jgi:hypothetical protein
MSIPPPLIIEQNRKDAEHLRLLAIFHFIFAGFAILGLGFLLLHYSVMNVLFTNPEMLKQQKPGAPDLAQFMAVFKWFYLVMGLLMVAGGLCNLFSGLWLRKRRNRIFSLVIAGLNCMQFPFGTALGVFTFIVLSRGSVREMYGEDGGS